MPLKLKKLYFAFKHLGWIFIGLIFGGFVLALTVGIIVGCTGQLLTPAFFICLACAAGFLTVLLVPLILFYVKFYKLIDFKLKLDGYSLYIVTNGLCGSLEEFKTELHSYLQECILTANRVFNGCDFYLQDNKQIAKALDGLYIIFVNDISEEDYFKRWGIRHRKIAGLNMGSKILVTKSIVQPLSETCCDHEIFHSIEDFFAKDLRETNKFSCVQQGLGLEC